MSRELARGSAPIVLPTRAGRIELSPSAGAAKCASGCGTMGGGLVLAQAFDEAGSVRGLMAFCGNCLAAALVRQIDEVQGRPARTFVPGRGHRDG